MTETIVKDVSVDPLRAVGPPVEGTPQLPAVQQTRKPSVKRALGKDAEPAAAVYSPSIAAAILKIAREVGTIQKEGFNDFQKYKYTRWEDINERLSPLLSDAGLIIIQNEISRDLLEENDKGSVLAIVYMFSIISENGDQWPGVQWTGICRLRDQKGVTDDKAALKCQTQAEKSFLVKLFKIRTSDGLIEGDKHAPLTRADARPLYKKLLDEINAIESVAELDQWRTDNKQRVRDILKDDWLEMFQTVWNERRRDLAGLNEYVDEQTGEVSGE